MSERQQRRIAMVAICALLLSGYDPPLAPNPAWLNAVLIAVYLVLMAVGYINMFLFVRSRK